MYGAAIGTLAVDVKQLQYDNEWHSLWHHESPADPGSEVLTRY